MTGPDLAIHETAHSARISAYLLGGKDHYEADRAVADQLLASIGGYQEWVQANRKFLHRAVRYLLEEAGVDQFIDLGAGLPAVLNTHEIAQAADPAARVLYVDNNPIVLAHARAILAGDRTAVIDADLRDPEQVLGDPKAKNLVDLERPVGVLLLDVLHTLPEADPPGGIVGRWVERLPPGSHVVISHLLATEVTYAAAEACPDAHLRPRPHEDLMGLFEGLDLVEPGLVPLPVWWPDEIVRASDEVPWLGGVGRR